MKTTTCLIETGSKYAAQKMLELAIKNGWCTWSLNEWKKVGYFTRFYFDGFRLWNGEAIGEDHVTTIGLNEAMEIFKELKK